MTLFYVSLLALSTVLSLSLAAYAWRHRPAIGAMPFAILTLAVAGWSATYLFELIGPTLSLKIFWAKVEYLGIVAVPVIWLVFALQYTRRDRWLTPRRMVGLSLIPALTLGLVWTNENHRLVWATWTVIPTDSVALLDVTHGGWFAIYTAYAYVLLLTGTSVLLLQLRSGQLYRRQITAILVGALAPWLGNALYLLNFSLIDPTPFAFTLSGLAFAWGLFRWDLLRITPIARAAIVEEMRDMVIVFDTQNYIVDVNPAALRALGRSAHELIGQPAALAFAAYPELLAQDWDELETHRELVIGEGPSRRYFELTITRLYDHRQRLVGRLVVTHNITQRKQAEAIQQEYQRYLEQLNRITQISIEVADFATMLQQLADQVGRLFQADGCFITFWDEVQQRTRPAAAYGPLHERYVSLTPAPGEATLTEAVLRAGQALAAEDVFNTPYISPRIAAQFPTRSLLGLPLIAGGQKLGAMFIAFNQPHSFTPQDIQRGEQAAGQIALAIAKAQLHTSAQQEVVDRQLAEQITQTRNDQLNALFAALPDLIVRLRPNGTLIDYHLPLAFASEPLPEFLLSQRLTDGLPAETAAIFTLLLAQTFATHALQTVELALIINHRLRHYEVRLIASGPEEAVCIFRDVTERKQREGKIDNLTADLRRSNADLEQFAYAVSHDLQEPLRMVSSYTQLLSRRYAGRLDADADEFIGFAVDGAKRMNGMIKGLLDYSRLGRQQEVFAPTDCNAALNHALANLHFALTDSGGQVTHTPLPTIHGNLAWLTHVFQNLISNALKFCPTDRPPRIEISASLEPHAWVFSIRDNGIGIAPEYFQRIFQIFQRLHTRDEYPGTGIGMATSRKIIERHGGRIWVESQVGEGSTFYFTLPAGEG